MGRGSELIGNILNSYNYLMIYRHLKKLSEVSLVHNKVLLSLNNFRLWENGAFVLIYGIEVSTPPPLRLSPSFLTFKSQSLVVIRAV